MLFADSSGFPYLQDPRLSDCKILLKDFSKTSLRHCGRLKILRLWWLQLEDGSVQDLKDFLGELQERATIEDFDTTSLYPDKI